MTAISAMPRYSHDRADRFARVAVAVALTLVLLWAGLMFHARDRESIADRRAIHALLDEQGRRINELTTTSLERDNAAKANISLNEAMARRMEEIARDQESIRKLIEARP